MKRNIELIVLSLSLLLASGSLFAASPYLDLHTLFDTDVFLASPADPGLGSGLDADGNRVDATTLPLSYLDGTPIATLDGRTTFKFGNFKTPSTLDGAVINAQTISVPAGNYSSLDLALLDAPNAFGWPFGSIVFNYADGSKNTNRFGPVAGWINSPALFDHAILSATDNSGITFLASFATTGGPDEAPYLYEDASSGVNGQRRFCDASAYVVYQIPVSTSLAHAILGITVGNDFVISVATSFTADNDPANFQYRTNGWTTLANSETIYGVEEKDLSNLKEYTFDVSPQLADQTGYIYILFTDATPSDGWGPFIEQIRLLSGGTPTYYTQRIDPVMNTSGVTVYAMFDVGTTNETPYLYNNSGSGPDNRGHRYADGGGTITYKFSLPTNTTNAKLTMDLENNFTVGLRGPADPVITYASFTPYTAGESNYIVDISCCTGNSGGNRFMDGNNYVVYQFTLPAGTSNALATMQIGNGFLVQVRSGTNGDWTTVLTNYSTVQLGDPNYPTFAGGWPPGFQTVNLAPYLTNNPTETFQIWIGDSTPTDGWGGYLMSLAIVNHAELGFNPVLNSQTMFGLDEHNELNKGYYTVDLSSVLSNNPTKEVYMQLGDASPADGWGGGIFWMAAYSGIIDIQSDRRVFNGLQNTPDGQAVLIYGGLDLLDRRYALDPSKTLSSIVLPAKPTDPGTTNSIVYLLAATLSAPPPTLGILLQPNNTVRLSWTTNASDYGLQSTPNLVPPQWVPVTASTAVVGDQITVTQSVAGKLFYRLAK
jgi:hypothetical protein